MGMFSQATFDAHVAAQDIVTNRNVREGYPGKPDASQPGGYLYEVPGKPGLIYVRETNGDTVVGIAEVYNMGAALNPLLRVRFRPIGGVLVIDMPIPAHAIQTFGRFASSAAVPPHLQTVAFGSTDFITLDRLEPGRVTYPTSGGLYLQINPFMHTYGNYPGNAAYDISTSVSALSSDERCWLLPVINTRDNTERVITSTPGLYVNDLAVPPETLYALYSQLESNEIALDGLVISYGMTDVTTSTRFIASRPILTPKQDLTVTGGATTVTGVTEISFTSGATVTNAGGGVAEVLVTGGGGSGLGDYLLFTHEEAVNTNGGTATSGSRQTRRLNYKRHDTGTNASIIELAFTSGGTYEVAAGNTITGATSGATATVFDVVLTSGTWAGGDAAGTLWLNDQTGTFQSENLNVGVNSNVATISGDSTSSNYRFRLAAGTYRIGGKFQFYDTGGVKVWLYNVTDAADQLGVYGQDSYTPSSGSANVAVPLEGRFTLAVNKTMCVQYQCSVTSSSTDGQGVRNNYGGNEIYATLELTKE